MAEEIPEDDDFKPDVFRIGGRIVTAEEYWKALMAYMATWETVPEPPDDDVPLLF